MKNRFIFLICTVMIAALLLGGAVSVLAVGETDPAETIPGSDPVYTETLATDPSATQGTGDVSDPSGSTDPTETGTTSTDPTETTVPDNTRGTEFVSSPTNSPYWATEGQFNASQYEGTEASWNNIDEDEVISLKNEKLDGVMSFEEMQNDRTSGDKKDYTLIIIGGVLILVSIASVIVFITTFAMGKKGAVTAGANAASEQQRRKEKERERRRRNDYHDGY